MSFTSASVPRAVECKEEMVILGLQELTEGFL
jgi:hypothetical protein